jgi:maleylacetate reductase
MDNFRAISRVSRAMGRRTQIEARGYPVSTVTLPIEPFEVELPPGWIVFGPGTLHRVSDVVEQVGAVRIMLIAGGSAAAISESVRTQLGERIVAMHDDVRQHVPEELADIAVRRARDTNAGGVITVGGGSSIGLGKVVAVSLEVPLIAIPTTYAGSEMTPVYGITGKQKVTRRDPRALPKAVVYDPTTTLGLPPRVTATSGLNALAHCMEAIVGPGATPFSTLVAREAAALLPDALRACVHDGSDLAARSVTQYAAFLAGRSLALAGTGLQHKLAHILGGRYRAIHAEVHAVLLPHVAAFHEVEAPVEIAAFAKALGTDRSASDALRQLAIDTRAPLSLEELGLPRAAIDVAIADLGDIDDPAAIRTLLENAFEPMMRTSTEGGS